jgi:polyhydroxyalkanoate synthesis repressor PhaR
MLQRNMTRVVKKYSNRRLYDTDESRYITLEELTELIREGADVRVVDAKSGEDLTQATLTQIILEGPTAKLLPVPMLAQLIRMHDDALAEFFSKYMTGALELYLSAKQGAQAVSPYFPFATLPFSAGNAVARLFNPSGVWSESANASGRGRSEPEPARDDVAELRKELDELKRDLKKKRR